MINLKWLHSTTHRQNVYGCTAAVCTMHHAQTGTFMIHIHILIHKIYNNPNNLAQFLSNYKKEKELSSINNKVNKLQKKKTKKKVSIDIAEYEAKVINLPKSWGNKT